MEKKLYIIYVTMWITNREEEYDILKKKELITKLCKIILMSLLLSNYHYTKGITNHLEKIWSDIYIIVINYV